MPTSTPRQPLEIENVVRKELSTFVPASTLQNLSSRSPLITGGVLDSITLVELVAALEDHFGIKFSTHEMSVDYFDSVSDIVDIVQSKLAEKV